MPAIASIEDLHGEHPLLTPAEYEDCRRELAGLRPVRGHVAVDARVAHLEALLRDARVVDDAAWDRRIVIPGRVVEVRYGRSGRVVELFVEGVPSGAARSVSPRSPVGRALLGRAAGEQVSVELPDGRTEQLTILSVMPAGHRAAA